MDWNEVDEKFKDVRYQSIPTYHDAASGLTRGKNGCWVIDIDGIRIVHLGDLGHLLKPAQIKKFGKVDVRHGPRRRRLHAQRPRRLQGRRSSSSRAGTSCRCTTARSSTTTCCR